MDINSRIRGYDRPKLKGQLSRRAKYKEVLFRGDTR